MVSKTGGDDPSTYRDVPMGKMFKYDSLGTTLRVPKENPNVGQGSCRAAVIWGQGRVTPVAHKGKIFP